jgi:hypothetical protein
MTTLLLLLTAISLTGIAVTMLLWRPLFRPMAAPGGPPDLWHPERPAGAAYRPMNRLLAAEDFCYLQGQARLRPGLVRRLRQGRAAVLRLYLREMGADFGRIHAHCRAMAVHSPDPNFASRIMKEVVRFYCQFGVLYAASFLPWCFDARVRGAILVDALARLEQAAEASLSIWAPASGLVDQV